MQKVDLNTVLELLINEEQDQATGLLHQWFVEKSKLVHENLLQEDDAVLEVDDAPEADSEESEAGEAGEGEEEAPDADDADAFGQEEEEELPLPERVEDLETDLARLKAQFNELVGDELPADDGMGDFSQDDMMPADIEVAVGNDDNLIHGLAEDDFSDLEESFALEPVKDPSLDGGKEIGAAGARVSVNDKSPIPQKKGDARMGGEAVVIKAEEHKGYERETSPEVKTRPLLKNQVKKANDGRPTVSKEGDKSAMLNKKDGFGSDSPPSPVASAKKG